MKVPFGGSAPLMTGKPLVRMFEFIGYTIGGPVTLKIGFGRLATAHAIALTVAAHLQTLAVCEKSCNLTMVDGRELDCWG